MSDGASEPSQLPNLPQLIMDVPEPVWQEISAALKVKTRKEAVQLVQVDQNAASIVQSIIGSQSALTQGQAPTGSALTSMPAASADRLYGGRAKLGI